MNMVVGYSGRAPNRVTRMVLSATVLGLPAWVASLRPRDESPEHRSIVVVDMAGSGRWNNQAQLRARAALDGMLSSAFRAAGIPRGKLDIEDRGDGKIVLVPAWMSKVDILDPVIPHLAGRVHDYNAAVHADMRIRLRVAVHAGEVLRDASGWAGSDLVLACRLVNGEPLYRELVRSPLADLVVLVSDVIHHGVVRHGYRGIDPDSYAPVRVLAKELDTRAWLHVPGTSGDVQAHRTAPY
jgi:hypothetical protein